MTDGQGIQDDRPSSIGHWSSAIPTGEPPETPEELSVIIGRGRMGSASSGETRDRNERNERCTPTCWLLTPRPPGRPCRSRRRCALLPCPPPSPPPGAARQPSPHAP